VRVGFDRWLHRATATGVDYRRQVASGKQLIEWHRSLCLVHQLLRTNTIVTSSHLLDAPHDF